MPALARGARAHGGGRSADAEDRAGSGDRRPVAAAGAARCGGFISLASPLSPVLLPRLVVGRVCILCVNTLVFGSRAVAADLLRAAGVGHRQVARLAQPA